MQEPFNDDDWIYELKLDSELVILRNGVPDFFELQRRTLLADHFKIEMKALLGIQHSLSPMTAFASKDSAQTCSRRI